MKRRETVVVNTDTEPFRFEDCYAWQKDAIVRATKQLVRQAMADPKLWAGVQEQKKVLWITGRIPIPADDEQFGDLIAWLQADPSRLDMASEETKAQINERLAMSMA